MVGHMVCIYLKENGHEVTGYSRRVVPFFDSIKGDVRNLQELSRIINDNYYDAVINAVGILNNQAEEDKESAVYINSYLPHFLSKITKELNTKIVHISTDCVFAGNHAPYSENDIPDGRTFYSRSKALGEIIDNKNITIRTSVVGPDLNYDGIGLLNWFMKQKGEVNGYTKVMWTGVTSLELARIIEHATTNNITGLFNMVGKENISKCELLKLFNKAYRDDKVDIIENDTFCKDMSLIRTNYAFDYDIPDYETMVMEMSKWTKQHNMLYPHYGLNKL